MDTNTKTKIVKKIVEITKYEEAKKLLVNLQFLKNLAKKAIIFLDYSAATKGIFSKSYKFKIYYKYDVLFLKNLIPKASEFTSAEVKHILLALLESFYSLRDQVSFMGNISQNSMIVQLKKIDMKDSAMFKKSLNKEDIKVNLLDFEAGLVYTHADMISKDKWVNNKIDLLRTNGK